LREIEFRVKKKMMRMRTKRMKRSNKPLMKRKGIKATQASQERKGTRTLRVRKRKKKMMKKKNSRDRKKDSFWKNDKLSNNWSKMTSDSLHLLNDALSFYNFYVTISTYLNNISI
jgi:hypothetical protein